MREDTAVADRCTMDMPTPRHHRPPQGKPNAHAVAVLAAGLVGSTALALLAIAVLLTP